MTELADFARVAAKDCGLCIASTLRPDGTIHSSLVNAGVLGHPVLGHDVAAYVAIGGSRKLVHLRQRPQGTLTARAGLEWASVDGEVEIIGPDDPRPGVDAEGLRLLLRAIFTAAGGTHDDWPTYDRVMAEERRAAVLITPKRVYSNS
ncbi:TIGR03618 family F420-dependent PPOX class oxidoreductase [Catenulispora yoronensis]|uniref:TIGR03618 family F420-dependent PPOX class oxidoreductase n=1 Tax=Catenulispora yoronensis TaxID=450799 RepID=A0ABN2UBL5_9ACTN